jgi:hypothetical protein
VTLPVAAAIPPARRGWEWRDFRPCGMRHITVT